MRMNDICILATGGTIDKEHDPISESLVFAVDSCVPEMVDEFRTGDIPHEIVMLKDSFDIDDTDRAVIKDAINARAERMIVVTHGTSTMTDTGLYLQGQVGDKVVVLTGAMRPFSLFRSDAGFNLGSAIAAAGLLDPGVYIAMNGQVFDPAKVVKDEAAGVFVGK